jgi:hypothetical protein
MRSLKTRVICTGCLPVGVTTRHRVVRWWLTCLVCVSGLLAWASAARATQVDLSLPGADAGEARLAVDPSGDAVAVWERVDADGNRIVQAAARDGWTFGGRVDLSLPGRNAGAPAVAIDQAGRAVVVWQRFSEFGHWVVQGATRGADGTIASLGDLSDTSSDDEAPQVAVDPAGDAVAVWEQDDHQRNTVSIHAAARSAGGALVSLGEVSLPGESGEQDDESPQVALDRAGDAFAVWEHFDGTNFVVQSAVRPARAAKFGAPVDVSPPQSTAHEDAVGPQVAVDPAGDAIVVWALGGGSDGNHWAVQVAARPAGATRIGAPQELSVAGQNQDLQLAVNQGGDAIAVWQRFDGANAFVDAASLTVGASAWSAVELAGAADPSSPQVALDAAGDAVAVWNDTNSVNQTVGTAYRPAGKSFSIPGSLSRPGANATDPHVALDQAGQTYAAWVGSDGKNSVVEGFLPDPPPGPGPPIPPPPVGGCTPHPGLPPCPPQTLAQIPPRGGVPSLSALRVSPGTFAAVGRLVGGRCVSVTRADRGRRRCTRPIALKVSLKLTVAAAVTFGIKHAVAGRRAATQCVAATRHNRKARRCTRLLVLPARITRQGHGGPNSFLVTHAPLAPGAYRLTAAPRANGQAGQPVTVSFRVVR